MYVSGVVPIRESSPRALAISARRVVVKVGTNVVQDDDGGLARERLDALVGSLARLRREGREVVLVSSGAVGLGMRRLGLTARPSLLALKQACAAAGQGRLMALYEERFETLGLVVAQVLLTEDDFADRRRYLNLRATLEKLLSLGAVPVLNENDTVSTVELAGTIFGDNDRLSALVASKLDAGLLVLLSDVDGLYDRDPRADRAARLVPVVEELTPSLVAAAGSAGARGRGGMKSKLDAARIATSAGAAVVIANGRSPRVLDRLFEGEEVGTLFVPRRAVRGKRRWIAFASAPTGRVVVTPGARRALSERNASLLMAGVETIEGPFEKGDVIRIVEAGGEEFARGIANFGSSLAARLVGARSDEVRQILGRGVDDTLVARDNIVLG
jgi:glutamate 5-kinase